MRFQELDPQVVQELLDQKGEDGQPLCRDMLAPMVAKEEAVFRNSSCPKCGARSVEAFVDPRRPFVPGNPLPHKNLRCRACQTEYDPYSGLITRTPTVE